MIVVFPCILTVLRPMDKNIKSDQKPFFKNITDTIPFGLLLVNPEYDIEYRNNQFAHIFGYDYPKSLSLSQWLDTCFPDHDFRKQARGILFHEIPYTQTEGKRTYTASIVTHQGREKLVSFTSLKLESSSFLIICNDVTEERKREADLQHTQIMEAGRSMACGVAHEFNNILMGIQGYVSLMLIDTLPAHDHYTKLKAIEEQIKCGSNLTEQLLERARDGRIEFKTLELNGFIAGLAAVIRRARNDIHITEQYSTYVWAVEADVTILEQGFRSIFAAAAGILPAHGTLLLKTDNDVLAGSSALRHAIKPGPYVRVSLSMPEACMNESLSHRLFSPAVLQDADCPDGIDLSFACGIIKGHEGMIEVESDPASGSAIHVYLPASSKTPHKKKPEYAATKTRTESETVLLVDDEKVITHVTSAMLSALGYDVIIASGGEEAVSLYQKCGDHIDLVIMDIVMPGMGGGEAIDLIRAINPSVKVILCSGYSMSGAVNAIMEKGVRHFLKKPFTLQEVSRKITEVMTAE